MLHVVVHCFACQSLLHLCLYCICFCVAFVSLLHLFLYCICVFDYLCFCPSVVFVDLLPSKNKFGSNGLYCIVTLGAPVGAINSLRRNNTKITGKLVGLDHRGCQLLHGTHHLLWLHLPHHLHKQHLLPPCQQLQVFAQQLAASWIQKSKRVYDIAGFVHKASSSLCITGHFQECQVQLVLQMKSDVATWNCLHLLLQLRLVPKLFNLGG